MELRYSEIKEGSKDAYKSAYERRKDSLLNTFHFHLNDHTSHEKFDFTEEISVYISFIIILIENKKDFSFLVKETLPLINKVDKEKIKKELYHEDYKNFEEDFNKASHTITKKYSDKLE